jgi:16S rRNA (guanine527-N7)-methyltransferase
MEKEFKTTLEEILASFGIEGLSNRQLDQLTTHYAMLRQWNRHINLTRIIEPGEAARLHYTESLFGGRFIADARTILDVGSGAGLPAIPLAVLRPDIEVTALEVNQKKILFLNEAKDALALSNLKLARERLESFDWSAYSLLTSRALDRAEQVLPLILENLGAQQTLMLYCSRDTAVKFNRGYETAIHPIPQADNRVIALFVRK